MNSRIRHKARRFGAVVRHGFPAALLSLLSFALLGVLPAMASVLQVPSGYPTIQAALDAASTGDEIVVQPGRYVETIHFLGKDVVLRSTDPEDVSIVESTIIDGNQQGSVVTFTGTETAACVLRGFTITNGWADHGGGINGRNGQEFGTSTRAAIESNLIHENTAGSETEPIYGSGGGIHGCRGRIVGNVIADNVSLEAEICTWNDNFGWECEYFGGDGGGLWVCAGLIEENLIIDNEAWEAGGGMWGCGGAIRRNAIVNNTSYLSIINECDGLIEENAISDNWTGTENGAVVNCKGSILNNIVVRNTGHGLQSSGQNGGVEGNFVAQNGQDQITGCDNVIGNVLSGTESFIGLISGGINVQRNVLAHNGASITGVYLIVGSQNVTNNIIAFNQSRYGGIYRCDGLIANNTLYGNVASQGSGGISESPYYRPEITITNNIIWRNGGPITDQVYESAIPTYSCIENDTSGEPTNISLDPKFLDPEHGDFSLRPDSPCIDAGAYVAEAATDIVGCARGFDGSPEPRGDGSDFDIGAYEFVMRIIGEGEGEGEGEGGPPVGPHSADRDGDWRIAMSELLRVIQFYNAHGYHCDATTEDGYAPGEEDLTQRRGGRGETGGLAQASESSSLPRHSCGEGGRDVSPSLDAEEPWEFVNPLEVKRSPLVEAYMRKYGIKLPEIPEEHIKLWRAWVTRQHGLSAEVGTSMIRICQGGNEERFPLGFMCHVIMV